MNVLALAARTHVEHNVAYAEALGGRVLVTDDYGAVDIGSPAAFLNALVALRPGADLAAAARDFFGEQPHSVVDYFDVADLAGEGYEPGARMPVMVRAPEPPPVAGTDLAIERVRDLAALAAFERVVVEGMELTAYADAPAHALWGRGVLDRPSMRLHLGRLAGRPVACAVGVVLDDCAGVFAVATLHDARRRGYGAAVTSAALADAAEVPAVLTSSPLGFGVYSSLGFETVGERTGWRRAPL